MKERLSWRKYWIGALLTVLLLIPAPTQAGGWVTVTMETLPRSVRTGESIEMRFVVRQHGQRPVRVDQAALVATHQGSGERLHFDAKPVEPEGTHSALVTFPQAGVWEWRFEPSPFPNAAIFAPLTVQPAAETQSSASIWLVGWLRGLVQRTQAAEAASGGEVEYGRALFLAKGCAACHQHEKASYGWIVNLGPELTRYTPDPPFMRSWLRNAEVLTEDLQWGMPTLELNDDEIDALILFLAQR